MESILVVEDDKYVRENLVQLLNMEGYKVFGAEDGLKAVRTLEITKSIDVIITDIMMPNLNGYELLDKVRNNKSTELIPLIFLTAKTNNEDIRIGMNSGANDYIVKPFATDELLNTVKAQIKKQKKMYAALTDMKENIIKYLPHEFRTPLVSIFGFSDILLNDLGSMSLSESKYMVERIITASTRLSELIEKYIFYADVVTNSTFHTSNLSKRRNLCHIKELRWKENFIENRAWNERMDDIIIKMEDASLRISNAYLDFIIKELVENSAKFSEAGTKINVVGTKNGSYYKLVFSDEGIGFNDTSIQNLTLFQQFERESMQQQGNGLGLATIKKILISSEGEIKLKSWRNETTELTVKIPLA